MPFALVGGFRGLDLGPLGILATEPSDQVEPARVGLSGLAVKRISVRGDTWRAASIADDGQEAHSVFRVRHRIGQVRQVEKGVPILAKLGGVDLPVPGSRGRVRRVVNVEPIHQDPFAVRQVGHDLDHETSGLDVHGGQEEPGFRRACLPFVIRRLVAQGRFRNPRRVRHGARAIGQSQVQVCGGLQGLFVAGSLEFLHRLEVTRNDLRPGRQGGGGAVKPPGHHGRGA